MEERDLHYLGVLGKRKRSISQLEINVEDVSNSADDKAAGGLIRSFVDRLQLQDELFDILDAIGKGFSVTQICWDTSMSQWMPRELKYRQPKWFRFSLEDGETLELWDNAGYLPLEPYAHVVHRVKAKSGLAIRAAWRGRRPGPICSRISTSRRGLCSRRPMASRSGSANTGRARRKRTSPPCCGR